MVRLREFVRSNGGGLYALLLLHRLNEFVLIRFGVAAAAAAATCGNAAICSSRVTLFAVELFTVEPLHAFPPAAAAAAAAAAALNNGFKPMMFGCVEPS